MNANELTYGQTWDAANRTRPRELMDYAPEKRIEVAAAIATGLKTMIDKQGLATKIGGGEHVRVEGWQAAGILCGLSAREVESHRDKLGWHATVDVVRVDTGEVVGRASSLCGHAESPWDKRDEYARKSMAATRATGKAFRSVIGWVVALAGYETTPAEEMVAEKEAAAKPKKRAGRAKEPATTRQGEEKLPPQSTMAEPEPEILSPDANLALEDIANCVRHADAGALEALAGDLKRWSTTWSDYELATVRKAYGDAKGLLNAALS